MARTSDILERSVAESTAERISLGFLVTVLGDRAFGLMIILMALPNLIPGPSIPGYSLVFGAMIGLLAAQMMRGFPAPDLPGWFLRRSLRREHLAAMIRRATPWLRRLERYVTERPGRLTTPTGERWTAFLCILLAFALALPLPMGNAPPALALVIISVGLLEQDDRTLMIGVIAGVVSLIYVGVLLAVAFVAFDLLFGQVIDFLAWVGIEL